MGEKIQFSEREKQVIELLILGKSNKQTALSLGISVRAVEFQGSRCVLHHREIDYTYYSSGN